ncbi:MAG TPA: sigma-54-dependent Fis family transcriptional regulator [Chondromyces sp.]|nr:sigma-54-dependent Fis family transcriptional regulator [Chondromyces sp.]
MSDTPRKVLVVEDESVVASDVQNCIRKIGHEVAGWATTAGEAVSLAESTRPDLVLMDIRLGGGDDGITAAGKIRERFDLPVVFLTAFADDDTLTRAKAVAPFGYIRKPFDATDVRIAIAIAVNKHEFDRRINDANRALEEETEFLNALFETIPASVMVVDRDSKIRMVNSALQRDFEVAQNTVVDVCPGDALSCPRAVNQPSACGTLDECLRCQLRPTITEGLAGVKIDRRRCQFTYQADDETRELTLLVSTTPLDHRGERLAIVILEDITELSGLRKAMQSGEVFAGIVGGSEVMQRVFESIREVADAEVPVAILGESGVGKELVARAIHDHGPRARKNFVTVNCGALPESLLESELFGHVKGAFTGSVKDRKGRFELADGGTIFLDEVADLTPVTQVKLLRVLQEGTFEPVGSDRTRSVDVRVLSATNKNLQEEVRAGRFREDLFYRLCVVPLAVPPLRERTADIPMLAEHFLLRMSASSGGRRASIADEVTKVLMEYRWPGNVRELQNVLQFAWIKCKDDAIRLEHLPPNLRMAQVQAVTSIKRRPGLTVESIAAALDETGGNKTEAAKRLGVSRATLYRFLDQVSV